MIASSGQPSVAGGIFRSTGVYATVVLAQRLLGFFLLPLYTRYLSPADYGVAELLELTLYVFVVVIGMQLGDALFYFLAEAKTHAERCRVASTLFLGSIAFSAVGAVLGLYMSPWLSEIVFNDSQFLRLFQLIFAGFALQMPQELALAYMRAMDLTSSYLKSSLLQMILAATVNVVTLAVLGWGLSGLLISKVAVSILMFGGLTIYMFRNMKPVFDFTLFRSTVKYAAPLGIGGIGMLVIHYGDRFFLQRYVSLAEIGIYALAYKLGMLIPAMLTPFQTYWSARKFSLVSGPQGEKLFVRVCTYQALAATFLVLLLTLFADPLVNLLAGSAYSGAGAYVPWVAAAYLLRAIGSHFRNVFLLEGKTTQEALIVWSGTVTCLAGYILLIPRFALWGAVCATGLTFSVMFFTSYFLAQRLRFVDYEYRRLGTIGLAGLIPILTSCVLPTDPLWTQLTAAVGLAALYPALLWIFGFLENDEQQFLWRAYAQFRGMVFQAR